jgi:hypothetical protein
VTHASRATQVTESTAEYKPRTSESGKSGAAITGSSRAHAARAATRYSVGGEPVAMRGRPGDAPPASTGSGPR